MLDRILVVISLAGLVAFCAIIVWYIHEPDLTVIIVAVLAIAIYDFWISVLRPQKNNKSHNSNLS